MADKTLQSIKFPQLENTYKIPKVVPEYDETAYYGPFAFCTYQGVTYVRAVNSDDYISGPFDPNAWFSISDDPLFWKGFVTYVSPFGVVPLYDETEYYYPGDIVFIGGLAKCIVNTTGPFDFNCWQPIWFDWAPIEDIYSNIDLLGTFTSHQYFNELWKENLEFTLTSSYATADVEINPEEQYEYIVAADEKVFRGDYFLSVFRVIQNQGSYDFDQITPALYHPTGMDSGGFVYRISNTDLIDMGNYTTVGIRIVAGGIYDSVLTEDDLESFSESIKIFRSPITSNTLDNSSISRLLFQDYTEVLKSLKDTIFSTSNAKAPLEEYIDSVQIPLTEGNIALQFVPAFNSLTWDDVVIDLRLGKNNIGTVDHWTLSKTDKTLYIVSEDSSSKGSLTDADYFKLRVSYANGDSPDYTLEEFINTHLNIIRKPKTQSSPNPIKKNSQPNINEFLNIARSYMKAEGCYSVEQPTFLQTDQEIAYRDMNYDDFKLDAQTFVGLCLRGLNFDNTPYSANWTFPNYPLGESSQEMEAS